MSLGSIKHWLLLRGLAREAWHWGDFPQKLQHELNAKEVLCLDHPGIGTARDERSPFTIAKIVANLRHRWLQHLAKSQENTDNANAHLGTWAILGQSLGGMVAIDWCHKYPQDFQTVVVINTSAANVSPPFKRFAFKALPKALRIFLSDNPLVRESITLALSSNSAGLKEKLLPKWAEHAAQNQIKRAVFVTQLWAAVRYRLPPKLATPLLLLTSKNDRLVDTHCSSAIAAKLNAPICSHDLAGHDLAFDDPEWIIERIKQYLSAAEV